MCIIFLRSVRRLLVTANVPTSPILNTLMMMMMMEALRSSETSVLTRAKLRNISEAGILHSRRRENLKSSPKRVFLVFRIPDNGHKPGVL
jgi:hypothetical protein